jgi:spore maturation protein CgeB
VKILCTLSQYAYGKPERGENYDYVNFLPALRGLGHEVDFFDTGDRKHFRDFADLNSSLLARVIEFRPDVMFCVLMHYEIWFETLDLIRTNSPVLVVNWGTDDSWKFYRASRFFAKHVDLHVTTDAGAANDARGLGLLNVFLSQWAGSGESPSAPLPSQECRYDVSFVGSIYGDRADWIAALRSSGIRVSCFGHNTENGVVDAAKIPAILRASRISLNFSRPGQPNLAVNAAARRRQIKARTFEVPHAGGLLLTETAPGLDRYFAIGEEITTFETKQELIERARYLLDHPDVRDQIAFAGHQRAIAEHTYLNRFFLILAHLHSDSPGRMANSWTLSKDALTDAVGNYRTNKSVRWVRVALIAVFMPIFGTVRGPRAARRTLYELSWRFAGEKTYRAKGLPGRLFYAES